MIKAIVFSIIGRTYAQNLIPCEDGTMADPIVGCAQTPAAIVGGRSDILTIILKVADGLMMVVVVTSVAALIYGGIVYAMSLGNETKIKTAKNVIFWSVFGLVVALLARTIVNGILMIITQ